MKSWAFTLFFLASCASGGAMMTADAFYDIPIGTSKQEVIDRQGKPTQVHSKEGGVEEFDYVERFRIGARVVMETHYILTLKEGKVTSKRIESSPTPPVTPPQNFNSLEMQTTQGE